MNLDTVLLLYNFILYYFVTTTVIMVFWQKV